MVLETVIKFGDQLFDKRSGLLSLWQMIASEFYPERADFTTARNLGDEFAKNLMTSYPVIARRDLGNAFGAMLRPTAKEWFKAGTNHSDREDTEAKQWLEKMTGLQKRAMYDSRSGFARATKEGDHDFAAFGQCCISKELNRAGNGLLYRCWHLRDVAWAENAEGEVDTVHRNWKPTATMLVQMFPKTVHQKVRDKLEKHPYAEINVRHVIMPAEDYERIGGKRFNQPYVSLYIDVDNKHEMECVGSWTRHYTIARWQTVSGSQYAHSPAVVAALPDARLLQAMTLTILSAGEKAVDPPMLAVKEAIRGDVGLYAGGITWVDAEYDERLGEVLRPLTVDKTGLGFGLDYAQDLRAQLADAFYLSKLSLPPAPSAGRTAYETAQLVQEFIRNTLPLFEPVETSYNASLCDDTFEILLRAMPEMRNSVPKSIQGADIRFSFESPIHDASERIKVGQMSEAIAILAQAAQLDPSAVHIIDGRESVRDTLTAVVPAKWLRTPQAVNEIIGQQQQEMETQKMLELMQGGADVAKTLSESGMAMQ